MAQSEPGQTRLWTPLTNFVGREQETARLVELVGGCRLVTVTGPGGVGKTRLAVEVARQVADRFPDGVYFAELGAVTDAARVPSEVAAVLEVPARGRPVPEALAEMLAARRLLLVLDNCEHVLAAVAELCEGLLKSADDLRILATSREQLWVSGETRYRLSPLELPGSAEPAQVARSAAVALFADRARRADPAFTLGAEETALAARVVARLDGMPLAIELAAARVEALGLAGLADRIDDALRLLEGRGVLAADRHRSLAAAADWSYRLLAAAEQRLFRRVAAFPGPFTLEAAEAVAGPEAGPLVLRLVDCSLLAPPARGPDGRLRYSMLQTLRAYGLERLKDVGEEQETAAGAAVFALAVASEAVALLETSGRELAALRWLDAEDATLGWALSWALDHDSGAALPLAAALAPWWRFRGRTIEGYGQLAAAAERCSPASKSWARAQLWLGHLSQSANPEGTLAHYTAAYESGDVRESPDALVGRAVRNVNYGQVTVASEDARLALALTREVGYAAGEAQALMVLCYAAHTENDRASALDWARQAEQSLSADLPGWVDRWCRLVAVVVLIESGELASARRVCGDSLARSRETGDLADLATRLMTRASLERLSGNREDARGYLREAVDVSSRIGDHMSLRNCLIECADLCAEKGQLAEALTLRAAYAADLARAGFPAEEVAAPRRAATRPLTADQARAAAERGARMTLAAVAEYVMMLTAPGETGVPSAGGGLTGRERELVTLVARGATNAEIAAQLFISVRTVSSHLDRIRDKSGYRRRADLTRLALREGLV
jgi:non-specific serine/threonine protein kinase